MLQPASHSTVAAESTGNALSRWMRGWAGKTELVELFSTELHGGVQHPAGQLAGSELIGHGGLFHRAARRLAAYTRTVPTPDRGACKSCHHSHLVGDGELDAAGGGGAGVEAYCPPIGHLQGRLCAALHAQEFVYQAWGSGSRVHSTSRGYLCATLHAQVFDLGYGGKCHPASCRPGC